MPEFTKLLCNVLANSHTKCFAVATVFHPSKINLNFLPLHWQSLQELSDDCILFDILKPIKCIDYFKTKTTCP